MHAHEARILHELDLALSSPGIRTAIDAIVARVDEKLREKPHEGLAWESVPLDLYTTPLPASIRSSWVFILRANTTSGAERHPNSHQRMMSYRGRGDFQTRPEDTWCSHALRSDRAAPLEERWISIPPNVWHQGVVPEENWAVVSFQTATEHELIEERPVAEGAEGVRRRTYSDARRD